jgi:hypothetical protein
MDDQIEEHMLIELADDFEALELDDGSRWDVMPEDIPTICTWIPTATVRISLIAPDSLWPYELTNTGVDISVRAMKKN